MEAALRRGHRLVAGNPSGLENNNTNLGFVFVMKGKIIIQKLFFLSFAFLDFDVIVNLYVEHTIMLFYSNIWYFIS
jgi:hypothetical protein